MSTRPLVKPLITAGAATCATFAANFPYLFILDSSDPPLYFFNSCNIASDNAMNGSSEKSVSQALKLTTGKFSLRRYCSQILRKVVLPAPQGASTARTQGPSIDPMMCVRAVVGSLRSSKSYLKGSSAGISISSGWMRMPKFALFDLANQGVNPRKSKVMRLATGYQSSLMRPEPGNGNRATTAWLIYDCQTGRPT